MKRLLNYRGATLAWFLCFNACLLVDSRCAQPVIDTGVAAATQDKPQCKLWFAHERWWAWLPNPDGSAVYARTSSGWSRLTHLDAYLNGLPGQADVWPASESVRAVLVGNDRLATADLVYDPISQTYQAGQPHTEFEWTETVQRDSSASRDESLETATICQDPQGCWWIAYDRGRTIYVMWSTDPEGMRWSQPLVLGSDLMPDDICTLYLLADRVGVIWSNQLREAVVAREHHLTSAPDNWSNPVYVQHGGGNADDHLHCAVDRSGTLFVASKNSVDQLNKPQQILRIRKSNGLWNNYDYASLTAAVSPTRPIALTGGTPEHLILLHTVALKTASGSTSKIVGIMMPTNQLALAAPQVDVLVAERAINNVTGPRHAFPENAPWIVLASDSNGGVYEADLRDVLTVPSTP
jgi:hypothetical protein